MKSDVVARLLWVLAGALGLGWIVNFALGLQRAPFDWRSAVDFPLVLLTCITLMLARGRSSGRARGGAVTASSGATVRGWLVAALVLGLAVAGVLGGAFAPGAMVAGR